ncbi:MAG: hypothetical protein JW849_11340, partial [Phycisphaerae bacterium]|nr:hypothetical protein [Phycisphaerae bacterium]
CLNCHPERSEFSSEVEGTHASKHVRFFDFIACSLRSEATPLRMTTLGVPEKIVTHVEKGLFIFFFLNLPLWVIIASLAKYATGLRSGKRLCIQGNKGFC